MKLTASGRPAIALWAGFILACSIIISRSQFTADLSAFLPHSPTPSQELLLEQIRDGIASRLILVGIEGEDAPTRARLSHEIAQNLRSNPAFVSVNNGEPVSAERDRAYLFNNRYLLSPAVTPEHFAVDGLHAALDESINLLTSPAGMLVKSLLPRDPTGEMVQLLEQLDSGSQPFMLNGAWSSKDGTRALMLIQTRAPGTDTDAQQRTIISIKDSFDATKHASARLVMSGPGVFSVNSRDTIQSQVNFLSVISIILIATLLLLVYRSFTALILGFLPVISGALAGIAAVSLCFGSVHGITLAFGTALIGEAVDYSIYLFVQSARDETNTCASNQQDWIKRYWPTVRLGVLTSIFGFASLLLSSFPGLAQLGLYSIAGLITAAMVTRFVLPHLLPANFHIHDVSAMGIILSTLVQHAVKLKWLVAGLLLISAAVLVEHHANLWNDKISSLSPVSHADLALDASLRADIGTSDVRYLVVVTGTNRESALQSAEQVSLVLQTQVEQGELARFESPSRYLPSTAMQRARQASLPPRSVLKTRVAQAVHGLPVQEPLFTPFITDVEAARTQPLLLPTDLEKTSMSMAVDALLIQQGNHWSALLPLTAPLGGELNATRINNALHTANLSGALLVDMKTESDNLYSGYLHEVILFSLGGLVAIIGLLLFVLRQPMYVLRIIAPLAAAVITVMAGLAMLGQQLILLHLVGLLLVVAVGSNYALFFARIDCPDSTLNKSSHDISPRTYASMLIANLTTVAGFGLLAFSNVSILQALGVTVAPGVILALIYSAIFVRRSYE